MKKKLKVLMVSAELNPIAKVGGLGDVVGALPKALVNLNCEVKLFLPFYGFIDQEKFEITEIPGCVKFNFKGSTATVRLFQTKLPGTDIPVFLVKHRYFSGKSIYKNNRVYLGKQYTRTPEDVFRFNFFSYAVLEASKNLNWQPDIIHCHDWHVASIPGYLKNYYRDDAFFSHTKTLYTIHNLANQGVTLPNDVDAGRFSVPLRQADDNINFMAQGIASANLVNTVSPTYASEILTKTQGADLEQLLRSRGTDLSGILNGIDVEVFNPETDKCIKNNYSIKSLAIKSQNKLDLQKQLGLKQDDKLALVGLVSRFVNQKGTELITEKFAKLNCQFVFLGTGQKEFEDELLNLSQKFPEKFSAQIKFDVELAQKIYAGADIFLMPSMFEPCGLGQMIAMRYGTIPVVRSTGGLADTVDFKVGFSFNQYKSDVLYKTLAQALEVYYDQPKKWLNLQKAGMSKDFSWQKPAKEYVKLYKKLTNNK